MAVKYLDLTQKVVPGAETERRLYAPPEPPKQEQMPMDEAVTSKLEAKQEHAPTAWAEKLEQAQKKQGYAPSGLSYGYSSAFMAHWSGVFNPKKHHYLFSSAVGW
jgi:ABC-type uncharacterized transport system involved in gliding motility auxiliary subunit